MDGDDANSTLEETVWSARMMINETTGAFNVTDHETPIKWYVYLYATGKDGVDSGNASVPNVYVHLYDPPPAEVFPPEFRFVSDVPVANTLGEQIVTKSIESYDDSTYWDDPKKYTLRRYYNMFLPSTFDV